MPPGCIKWAPSSGTAGASGTGSSATMCAISSGAMHSIPRWRRALTGSRDLYPHPDRDPNRGINFVTCHDGFTLNDLVSYDTKHNQANLLGNTRWR